MTKRLQLRSTLGAVIASGSILLGVAIANVGLPSWVPIAVGGVASAAGLLLAPTARGRVIAGSLTFGLVFAWTYVSYLQPSYSYMGIAYTPGSVAATIVVFVAAALPAFVLPTTLKGPSQVVLWLLYVLAYIPATLVPYFIVGSLSVVAPLLVTLAISMVAMIRISQLQVGSVPTLSMGWNTWITLLLAASLAIDGYVLLVLGLPATIPGFDTVYDVRSAYQSTAAEGSNILGYLVPWAGYALNPLLLAFGLTRRQWVIVIVALLSILLIYASTGHKSVILGPILIVGILLLVRSRRLSFAPWVVGTASAVVGLATLASVITSNPWAIALVPMRMVAAPGLLTAHYFKFFSENPTYELRHSLLSFLGSSPYEVSPPYLIGRTFFNSDTMAANANLWADGIANFGVLGALVMSVVFAITLRLLDICAEGKDLRIVAPAVGLMGLIVSNSAALTSMLTHGLLLMCLCLALMPRAGAALLVTRQATEDPPLSRSEGSGRPAGGA